MSVVDEINNTVLVDRETGEDHVCTAQSAKEIFAVGSKAKDGEPRYVFKTEWDGKLAEKKTLSLQK